MPSYSDSSHLRDGSLAERRLRESERRLEIVSKEYDDRIAQLELDLANMKHEIAIQRKIIAEHKTQEKHRLDQIQEVRVLHFCFFLPYHLTSSIAGKLAE